MRYRNFNDKTALIYSSKKGKLNMTNISNSNSSLEISEK